MNVKILHLIEGAKQATGLTVVIDVFRAYSLEAYLLSNGASRILPLADKDEAYRLKAEHPEYILAGERHGKILEGFDLGNSPSQLSRIDVTGKTVIHTTSAGTQGIANATHADEILGGSLLTAKATAEYILRSGAKDVSLVCMGLEAVAPSQEDTLCAEYIKSLLLNEPFDVQPKIDDLRFTSGAKFFDPAQRDVFPEEDFHLCVQLNKFDFVCRVQEEKDGKKYMRKFSI